MKTYAHLWYRLAELFLEWQMFHTKLLEKTKTQLYVQYFSISKIFPLWDNVQNRRGHIWQYNMEHALCFPGT